MKKRIGVSGCLIGMKCNFNGTDLLNSFVKELQTHEEIEFLPFCPEETVFGTPRPNLRIVGGDGFDVLDGKAFVINEHGVDVTEKQVASAKNFLLQLQSADVNCAILMDGSPSCGSNVLLKEENWPSGGWKRGVGVTTALLKRNGIVVLSCFDQHSVSRFLEQVLSDYRAPQGLQDLKDNMKFKTVFAETREAVPDAVSKPLVEVKR